MIGYVLQYVLIICGDIMVSVELLVQLVLLLTYQISVLDYVMQILIIKMVYVLQTVQLTMLIRTQDYVLLPVH